MKHLINNFEGSINDNWPLVSVIMSVYNTNPIFLVEAIESILNQTYQNLEFIIVDDGSSDDAVKKVLEFYNNEISNIHLIVNEVNIGLTKSLNIALGNSKGDYIARMDADDISLPDRIRQQVEKMEADKTIVLCGTNTIGFTDDLVINDTNIEYKHSKDPVVRDIHLIFENEGFAHPTFMLRNSFLKEHGVKYREDIKHAQDYAMTTDCIMNGGHISLVDASLLLYRMHKGQITENAYQSQVKYQAITAFRRIRNTFETLTDDECWAVATINHERQDYSPKIHMSALRKIFTENKRRKLFNQSILRREFQYEWYRKCMRISRINKKPWGFFSLFSVESVIIAIYVKQLDAIKRRDSSKKQCRLEKRDINSYEIVRYSESLFTKRMITNG